MNETKGLELQINENFRITCTDGMNYIPEQLVVSPAELNNKPNPKAGTITWKKLGYYPTLELALVGSQSTLHHLICKEGNISITELIKFIKQTKTEIVNSLSFLKRENKNE